MKDYLRWSLRQLFLLYFQPTRFQREVEGEGRDDAKLTWRERAGYMLKMLPWMILLSVAANIGAGLVCQAFGLEYRWAESWKGEAVGMAVGVMFGVAFGVVADVAFWSTYFRLYAYWFDALLSVISYLRRKGNSARAWRLCPVSWNEVIWLPLPFCLQ